MLEIKRVIRIVINHAKIIFDGVMGTKSHWSGLRMERKMNKRNVEKI